MFENLIGDIKKIIAAFDNPSVDTIGTALEAAGSLLKQGYTLFKDLFGKKLAFEGAEPLEACRAWVAEMEGGGVMAAEAIDWSKWLNLLALIKKLLDMFS